MGFVDFFETLSSSQKIKINESKIEYFIPWVSRFVVEDHHPIYPVMVLL